jgi:two-component system sensor histidine kinase and response regulator WspE
MTKRMQTVNESMLDLFSIEVETQTKKISSTYQALQTADDPTQAYEQLINACRAIKGAANLVHVDIALRLINKLENTLSQLQSMVRPANEQLTQTIQSGTELIQHIASLDAAALNQPGQALLAQLDIFEQSLDTLLDSTDTAAQTIAPQDTRADTSHGIEQSSVDSSTLEFSLAENIDADMYALFLVELHNSLNTIANNLLESEDNPQDDSLLQAMMRAAHSIKGAARMIGIDAVVKLSHAMEDVFVAAQKHSISLQKNTVDQLFFCVDLLKSVEDTPAEQLLQWTQDNTQIINQYLQALRLIQSGQQAEPPQQPEAPGVDKDKPAQTAAKSKSIDSSVRVSAERINRLVGLAGELSVTSHWLRDYADSMLNLKRKHNDILAQIERLRSLIDDSPHCEVQQRLVSDIQHHAEHYRDALTSQIFSLDNFDRRSSTLSSQINHEIIASRMRPFSDSIQGYKRVVRDLSSTLNKKVNLHIKGEQTTVDRDILEKLEAPLNHMIRNAIDHGIESPEERRTLGKEETGNITITASHQAGRLLIQVKDDGCGVDTEIIREKILSRQLVTEQMAESLSKSELLDFLFLPAFSTRTEVTELSGRGVGLDIVHSALQETRGKLHCDSEPGQGMQINMELPLTLSVIRSLLVSIKGELYAFPLAKIHSIFKVNKNNISTLEDKQYVTLNDKHIGLIHCSQILGVQNKHASQDEIPVIIIGDWHNSYGLVVDELLGERSLALRTLNKKLGKIKDISAAALTDDGEPVLLFDTDDLLQSIQDIINGKDLYKVDSTQQAATDSKRVLIVDDSLTVREIEKKLLESRGYLVDIAIDGVDGWNTVRSGHYDLVISDVDMPRMNGIELIKLIKNDAALRSLPVMMVSYKDRSEDKQKGLEAGADYYLTKGSFHDDTLIDAVIDLIGEASS